MGAHRHYGSRAYPCARHDGRATKTRTWQRKFRRSFHFPDREDSTLMNTTTTAHDYSSAAAERSRSLFSVSFLAFLALLRRDLLIARHDFIGNLVQWLVVPAFFLFIFGRVLPQTGAAAPAYGALLLPGMVAMSLLMTALFGITLPLVIDIGNEREIEDRLLAPLPTAFVANVDHKRQCDAEKGGHKQRHCNHAWQQECAVSGRGRTRLGQYPAKDEEEESWYHQPLYQVAYKIVSCYQEIAPQQC